MRRALLAIAGTAIGTTLLVGLKTQQSTGDPTALVAGAPGSGTAVLPPPGGAAGSAPGGSPNPSSSAPSTGPSEARSSGPASPGPKKTTATSGTTTKPAATTPAAGGLATGSFTGSVVQTKYGPVQVKIVVSGGRMTDVVALQLPSGASRSVQINDRAAPILRQEALTAQSAKIDTVSGATYTSNGYRTSLQAAIDAAKR